MRSPIVWFGGKGILASRIVRLLEEVPHTSYVEPFGGGASVLLAKKPVGLEVYNDLDAGLYNFFSVISDPDLFEAFYRRVSAMPYSRRIHGECRAKWRRERNRVKAAAMWFVAIRQSFSGKIGNSWSVAVTPSGRRLASTTSRWITALSLLPDVHARLLRVQIESADWRVILARYDTPDTLFYCDPPYIPATRSQTRYEYDMTMSDHEELVEKLLLVKGKVVLSGYAHPLYDPLVNAGWERIDWPTACFAVGRTRQIGAIGKGAALKSYSRTESAWISPSARVDSGPLFSGGGR